MKKEKKKRPNLCKTELNTPALQFMVKPSTAPAVCLCDPVTAVSMCCFLHRDVANTAQAGQSSAAAALPGATALAYLSLALTSPAVRHFPSLGLCLVTIATGGDSSRNTLKTLEAM